LQLIMQNKPSIIADRFTFSLPSGLPHFGPMGLTGCLIWAPRKAIFWTYDSLTGERLSFWIFEGPQVPEPSKKQPRFHFNLWSYQGYQDFDRETEIVVCDYHYSPPCFELGAQISAVEEARRPGRPER